MPGQLGGLGFLIHRCSPFRLIPIRSGHLGRAETRLGARKEGAFPEVKAGRVPVAEWG